MLLSIDGVFEGDGDGNIGAKVFSCLASTKRDIDIMGWYRQDSVAGIIFTEISSSNDWSAVRVHRKKNQGKPGCETWAG